MARYYVTERILIGASALISADVRKTVNLFTVV